MGDTKETKVLETWTDTMTKKICNQSKTKITKEEWGKYIIELLRCTEIRQEHSKE